MHKDINTKYATFESRSKGGKAVVKKYGVEYMEKLSKKAAKARKAKAKKVFTSKK